MLNQEVISVTQEYNPTTNDLVITIATTKDKLQITLQEVFVGHLLEHWQIEWLVGSIISSIEQTTDSQTITFTRNEQDIEIVLTDIISREETNEVCG